MLLIFFIFYKSWNMPTSKQTLQSTVYRPNNPNYVVGTDTKQTTSCQHTPVRPPEVPESPRSKPPPGLVPDLSPGRARTTGHAAGETEEMAAADSATASSSSSPECPAAPSMPTDPDFLSCVLQPPTSSSSRPDADYAALRRLLLLLRRKPPSALQHRMVRRRTPAS